MGLLEDLVTQGWHLLPTGLERLLEGTEGETIDAKQAIKLALDTDLREIGGGALASITARGTKTDTIDGNIVVQILKVRNISAPKANEESKTAPRLLKLTLTDGQTQYSALEGEHVPTISLNTPPGTKIYLKNGPLKISQGLLILNADNVAVLGGKVAALVEKWELGRTMAKYAKGGRIQYGASGPPPWVPFGQKIQQQNQGNNDKNFKSLQTKEKDESKENAEFTAQRNDAIAEATKLGTKKTFGGGAKQMVDANVQKIMDKGFSEEQATHALKLTRNNVHRALSNLQRIEDRKQNQNEARSGKIEPPQKPGKRGMNGKRELESDATSKPSTKVSLFDFLEDILPESDTTSKKSTSKDSTPFGGKDSKTNEESYANKQSLNMYSSTGTGNQTTHSASSSSLSNQYQSNSTSHYSNTSKNYNQQRFENNISSSFANRNSGPGNRGYNQQQQSMQQSSNPNSGYKQSSDYNSRYRGPPSGTTNDAYPRNRQDSKYSQSHSSHNPSLHQSQSQYRSDNYNNNAGGSSQANKYNSHSNPNGTSQQQPNANYGYAHAESRTSQGYNAQGDSRKHAASNHYQQTQQQPAYNHGHKPIQGYNANNLNTGSHISSQHGVSNHYGQQSSNSATDNASSYNGGAGNAKMQKGSRYGKDESLKATGSTPNATAAQGRKTAPKGGHGSSQPSGPNDSSSTGTHTYTGGAKQANVNNNSKITQLAEATANMHIGGKSFTNNNPPKSATSPVVPKNLIQLPNGFNYNPYQIMGFQNKQTNEFALNVLKSQQFDALQSAHLVPGQPGAPVQTVPGAMTGVPMAPSMGVMQSVLTTAQAGTATVAHPPHPTATTAALPNWKVGDRCLAKYWEDGNFYNAEITGISENTFVVGFLEYGNFEEVLKTDCIPVSQAGGPSAAAPPPPHHGHPPPPAMGFHPSATHLPPGASIMPPPAGAYHGQGVDSQTGQHFNHSYKTHPNQYPHHLTQQQQQQRPSKFREQRPMYVPPAQRK